MKKTFIKDRQYVKFCAYGFLKNLQFFEPFLLLFFVEKGISFTQIGILYAVREITRNILEIPAGIAADALGRRRTMLTSFGFYMISFVAFYLSPGFYPLMVAMLLYALGDAFRTGTHKAMIFDYLKLKGWQDQKVYYYGHTRSFSQLGSALSALLAAMIVLINGNYSSVFLISILPFALNFFLILSYPKELDGRRSVINKGIMMSNFRSVIKDFIFSFKNINIVRSIGNTAIFSAYYKSVKDYIQPVIQSLALTLPVFLLMEEKSKTALVIGIVYFVIYLLSSFSARAAGNFSGRFSKLSRPLNLTLVTGLLAGISVGVFFSIKWYILAVGFYVLVFMIENLRKPAGMAYVADQLDKDILATALSTESQLKSLIAGGLAILLGSIADSFGIGQAMMVVSVFALLLLPVVRAKN